MGEKSLAKGFIGTLLGLSAMTSYTAGATEPGFYLGGGIGSSEFDSTGELERICEEEGLDCSSDDSDTGFRFFGGYQINDWFAVEGGYTDLGALSAAPSLEPAVRAEFTMSGVELALLPQLPLGEVAFLYGRLGAIFGEAELTARTAIPGLSVSESETGPALAYGVGAGFNLGSRFSLRFDWTRFSLDEILEAAGEDFDSPDIDLLMASLIFRFPQ